MTAVERTDTRDTTRELARLAESKFVLLTTFRKDGTPAPAPVCHAVSGGVIYVTTAESTGKVKRIRNQPRVLICTCDIKGAPTGPALDAHARFVSVEEFPKTNVFTESSLLGATFRRSARAHWIVKPVQLYERLRFGHRFIGVAIEPTVALAPPAEAPA